MTISVRKIIQNIIRVAFSNSTTILSGIVVGFIIPKILTVEDYGYYKAFTLYTTYIGFVSLGIIDGIVLEYGGYNYSDLDTKKFRGYFYWYSIVHIITTILILILAVFISEKEYRFVMIFLGLNIIPMNFSGYFQQISQITQRFREYSFRKVLQSTFTILAVMALFIYSKQGGQISYIDYLLLLLVINYILVGWYIHTYKDIVFDAAFKTTVRFNEILKLIKNGFPLLFANLCSTLILTLDRQFVNILYDTSTYAVYAFAYSMMSLVTVGISSISIVIYPILKRTSENNLRTKYSKLITIILCFSFLMISIYFPLREFINWYLPKYNESLIIFRIIFPGIAISSAISIVMHNYYKTLGINIKYFKKSIKILIISGLANLMAYLIWGTPISISIASIISLIAWYVYIEQFFVSHYNYNRKKNLSYISVMTAAFYLSSMIESSIYALISYIISYLIVTIILFKNEYMSMINIKKYR